MADHNERLTIAVEEQREVRAQCDAHRHACAQAEQPAAVLGAYMKAPDTHVLHLKGEIEKERYPI